MNEIKPMQALREEYCTCICCCSGQCNPHCPWCQIQRSQCICGTTPEDAQSPCQPCNTECQHLNCSPEAARRMRQILETEATLNKFRELPHNWDSYGASPISETTINEARQILEAFRERNLPVPWTAPGGDGGIGIQLESQNHQLYIDLIPGRATTYVLNGEDGVLTPETLEEILDRAAELEGLTA